MRANNILFLVFDFKKKVMSKILFNMYSFGVFFKCNSLAVCFETVGRTIEERKKCKTCLYVFLIFDGVWC